MWNVSELIRNNLHGLQIRFALTHIQQTQEEAAAATAISPMQLLLNIQSLFHFINFGMFVWTILTESNEKHL